MSASAQPPLQLSAVELAEVLAVLHRLWPHARASVFGSRATGRARPYSDLDLLLTRPAHLTWDERAQLRDAFEASNLPFKVDVLEADQLSGAFAQRVQSELRPLHSDLN